ncbi:E3 ubiquitin-protein ligase MARCHF6 isoform X2 [Ischnura elegans]|uniref:E3 ubiquitin-protein ligase MARCHF6 isoform X2 n=1 Tax=Ischnura elegans TaxID=197161 RepID=UPI001ED8903C|nr:E3 ubiquitin-protein ligase MARCHF6 isoform X2 [Ischnura elegans]
MDEDVGKDGANGSGDICRVCRCEGTSDRPLFHPCLCAGSIKFIHQECLVQWMRYSRKEFCELCGHLFSFTPIYAADMPGRLPLKDVLSGLAGSVACAAKHWLHYSLVALAWLGFVPLIAYRVYRLLFTGSVSNILTLPLDLLSLENVGSDVLHGFFVVSCTLVAFIGLVWLREQILHGGGPDWMDGAPAAPPDPVPPDPAEAPPRQQGDGANLLEADVPPEDGENNNNPNNNNNNNNNNINNNPPEELVEEVAARDGEGVAPVLGPEEEPEAEDGVAVVGEGGDVGREGGVEGDGLGVGAGQGAGEWNHLEWERAAEELTWERLLGLDGSLLFLEHVFWVVSLNSLFVLVFAFCPYHVGHFAVVALRATSLAAASRFEGLVTTLVGYCALGIALALLHALASALKLARARHLLALCCLVVKVSLLSVVEIGVLPLACGWWLDVCSLALFDAALKDRELGFRLAPGTSLFLHWLFGMMYVYYFASFVLLLREVLRPGVLWFLKNLNDPDFSPIREMIHLPLIRHARRLIASAVIFGTVVLLMLWLPVQLLRTLFPSFLPYTVSISATDHPGAHPGSGELSLELLLLQVVLPAILEQSHARVWLKSIVRGWCLGASWLLGLHSYLLGDPKDGPDAQQAAAEPEPEAGDGAEMNEEGDIVEEELVAEEPENDVAEEPVNPPPQPQPFGLGLGVAHQALLQREGPQNVGVQVYVRPPFFPLRLAALLLLLCVSLVFASVVALTLPVWLGRQATALWLLPPASATTFPTNSPGKVHELYTAACGLYVCWAVARAGGLLAGLALAQGRIAILPRIRTCLFIAARSAVACILLLGVFPLMFGLLLEVVVVVPLRVPLNQTPLLFVWQDWALGVLYTKIAVALVMILGPPDWWLRRALERAYRDGIHDLSLSFIVLELAAPLLMALGLALAVPYAIAHGLAPLLVSSLYKRILIARSIYPSLLLLVAAILMVTFQVKQFRRLYAHIRDDKYLVGRRLVNYNHQRRKPSASMSSGTSVSSVPA